VLEVLPFYPTLGDEMNQKYYHPEQSIMSRPIKTDKKKLIRNAMEFGYSDIRTEPGLALKCLRGAQYLNGI
jgi:hypothetical protein